MNEAADELHEAKDAREIVKQIRHQVEEVHDLLAQLEMELTNGGT